MDLLKGVFFLILSVLNYPSIPELDTSVQIGVINSFMKVMEKSNPTLLDSYNHSNLIMNMKLK